MSSNGIRRSGDPKFVGGGEIAVRTLGSLWFFLWRMTSMGLGLGTVLGAVYGFVLPGLATLVVGLMGGFAGGISDDLVGGALTVTVFGGLLGALYGGFLGAVAGSGLGSLNGLLLFALTRAFFRSSAATNPRRYRRTCAFACTGTSVAVLFAYWVYPSLRDLDAAVPTFTDVRLDLMLVVVLPVLIAAAAMGLLGALTATWHFRKGSEMRQLR